MKEKENKTFQIDIEEMAKAGVHFGHRISRMHPKMRPYIYGIKNNIHFIDLEKSAFKLREALEFIKNLVKEGKTLLLIGTKNPAKSLIKEIGEELSLPYVSERWLGGTFTNFEEMKKRINYFKELKEKSQKEEFEKYTKKEKLKMGEKLEKLEMKFGGLRNLEKLPEAIFVCDMKKDKLACKEAKRMGIKIVGIADTNVDPNMADYPIPGNDDALSSLKYILDKVKEAILQGREEIKEEAEENKA